MDAVQQLVARLTEVEKMKIRMSTSEDALVARYHDFRSELAGSHRFGGTEEEGIQQMKEVQEILTQQFYAGSNTTTFGRSWAF